MRRVIALPLLLAALLAPGLAQASCTQAEARARMDTLNALAERLPANSPQYNRLLAGVMQIMSEPQITESTCTRLDGFIAEARR